MAILKKEFPKFPLLDLPALFFVVKWRKLATKKKRWTRAHAVDHNLLEK
jgi:hypothetical protein